ncbi:Cna B-type domain-containing protein [Arcanobacterium phocae]|uniref:Cna B-type domain-containing protein n=1 Tax=Arcanobacterium phocae TaxID=131112 RepID=UPI001C0EA0D3|nr:Cna B-type domain-containing protein [Arcanobacterium phocae]
MTIGTGSTGDTEGGSIGAKANGLHVSIPAYADFRYVLDSEYRQALGITDTESDGQPIKLPHRPLASWSGELAGSTYTTIACLEDSSQFLSPVLASQKTAEIYPELAKKYPNIAASTDEVQVADGSGSYGLGRWPYEFSLRQPGTWASASGLRPMNYDSAAGQFLDYEDKNLPYKPTFESVKKEIPGYTYVDNDLPVEEKGVFDSMGSGGIPLFKPAPNIKLSYHKQVGYETQHLYFTYKKNPGTFRVEKTNPDGVPIAGAKFALYKVVDNTPSACGVVTEVPPDVEDIKVCDATDPQACAELTAQQVVLDDFETSDGTFVTGVDGTYMPAGEPSLEPGRYVVKELSMPEPYLISRQYTVFEIPIQAGKNDAGELVSMTVPGVAKAVNHPDYVNVLVTKVWDDGDDVDGLRPLKISVELLADGMPTGKQVELNADNNWSAQFTDLPRTKDGRAIVYSVAEEVAEGYQVTVSGDAQTRFVLTNSHKPVVPPTPPVVPGPGGDLARTGISLPAGMVFMALASGVVGAFLTYRRTISK